MSGRPAPFLSALALVIALLASAGCRAAESAGCRAAESAACRAAESAACRAAEDTPEVASATTEEMVVVAEGRAALGEDPVAGEEEAIWDAKRNAVEQAAGVFLRAKSIGRDAMLEDDRIQGRTEGFIRHWQVVANSQRVENAVGGNGRILILKVRAVVALLPLVRRLEDIVDVYNDLERPRLRVEISSAVHDEEAARHVQHALLVALKTQGFEIARDGAPAEIVLIGRLEIVPTVRMGDRDTPFGVGKTVAACRARLLMRVESTASEETLFTARADGGGASFQGDLEAAVSSTQSVIDALLNADNDSFVRKLLVHWVQEREEGHTIVVKATGLDARQRTELRAHLAALRGFLRFTPTSEDKKAFTLRFLTRSDTRSIRRNLAALALPNHATLLVRSQPGPLIVCALSSKSL